MAGVFGEVFVILFGGVHAKNKDFLSKAHKIEKINSFN